MIVSFARVIVMTTIKFVVAVRRLTEVVAVASALVAAKFLSTLVAWTAEGSITGIPTST